MGKIRLSKRGIAIILAGGLTLGTVGYGAYSASKKDPNKKEENSIGYENINPIINFDVDEEDFIILDIGDHNSVGVHFQDRKMKYCNEHDISLGVVISTDAETEDAIYDDVEYVKGVLSNYEVDFPVYLNIDKIITNDDLNTEMKTKLIKNFLEKCASNNIYVGMYGTDKNLRRVRNRCDITGYDAFVVQDDEEIKYKGTYNVYKDLDGNIKAETNLAEVITGKELNSEDNFANDGSYTLKENDDIIDIALKYGMSVNELLKFNELSKKDLKVGTVLRIPMKIGKTEYDITTKYKRLEEPIRGCDMSYAQSDNQDWDQLKENFEFIILKCTQGMYVDSKFEENAEDCNINNIPIGVYCFNGFFSNNCANIKEFNKKQREQANFVVKTLNNKKIEYPVYLDIESLDGSSMNKLFSKKHVNNMLDIWNTKIAEAGYIPGIYCNRSTFEFLQSHVDYNLSKKFEVWIAGGSQYGNENDPSDNIEFENVVPSYVLREDEYGATMAQSTNTAINAGACDGRGHLDINYSLVDYKNAQRNTNSENIFSIKKFDRIDYPLVGGATAVGIIGIAGAIGVVKHKSKNKTKRKIRK